MSLKTQHIVRAHQHTDIGRHWLVAASKPRNVRIPAVDCVLCNWPAINGDTRSPTIDYAQYDIRQC